jgi:hypothetical protein
MQPTPTISQDIKTLADWTYQQFKPTDPIEVQNILDKPYYFKYCVGETIETPDQVSRKVVDRQYEEITFEPGETKILMGAAAYVFLGGIAPAYVLQTKSQEAMGDLAELIAAADLAIIGKVGYARHADLTTRQGFSGFIKELQGTDPEAADLIRAAAVANGLDINKQEVKEAMAGFEKETESFFADYRKPLDSKAKKMFGKGYLELTDDERSTLLKDKRMSAAAEAYDNVVAMARSETDILGDETKKEVMKATGLSTEDGGMTATFNNVTISLNGEVVAKNASSTSPVKSDSKGSVKTPNH